MINIKVQKYIPKKCKQSTGSHIGIRASLNLMKQQKSNQKLQIETKNQLIVWKN